MKKLKYIPRKMLRREDGQAFVEFALVLPFLALLVFAIAQFGVAFHDYISITDAARVGARAAAVEPVKPKTRCQTASDAIGATLSEKQKGQVSLSFCDADSVQLGQQFKIEVTYPLTIDLVGFSAGGNLTALAKERRE